MRWCLRLSTVASVSIDSDPPAERIADGLTGIPPFKDTTARFKRRPTAIIGAAGIQRFTARNPNSRR
jgi:hypothetical protein